MHERVASVRRRGVLRVRSRSCEGAQHGSGSETGPEEVGGEHVIQMPTAWQESITESTVYHLYPYICIPQPLTGYGPGRSERCERDPMTACVKPRERRCWLAEMIGFYFNTYLCRSNLLICDCGRRDGKAAGAALGAPSPFCVFLAMGACTPPSSNAIPILRAIGASNRPSADNSLRVANRHRCSVNNSATNAPIEK